MINVVQEIVDKLRTVYPSAQYDIYTERIGQGFSAPCFSIRQLRADVEIRAAVRAFTEKYCLSHAEHHDDNARDSHPENLRQERKQHQH